MKEMRTLGESKVSCDNEGNEKVGSEMGEGLLFKPSASGWCNLVCGGVCR